ncbi:hypothetical protein D3C71_22780 [compost metagenome]
MPAYAPPPMEVVMPAPTPAGRVTQAEADRVLAALQQQLRATKFVKAWPSDVPGLVALRLDSGQVAYSDKSARYFFLGVVLDTATGAALDGQMDAITTNE